MKSLLIKIEEKLLNYLEIRKYKRQYKEHLKMQEFINSIIVRKPDEPIFKLKNDGITTN